MPSACAMFPLARAKVGTRPKRQHASERPGLAAGTRSSGRLRVCYATRVPRSFLIDTDTASDDAVALIMALRAPDVSVVGITTVAGNVPVAQATRNALYVTELCGADVPVYAGAAKPLWREHVHAEWFHGKDGLGDQGYPPPRRSAGRGHAVEAIIGIIQSNPGIVLVTLGPLTK